MVHWIRSKNLPYSVVEIRLMTASCKVCAEIKPRFCQSKGQLIKAIAPFERINIDFKGPLPSNTQNRYLLTIIDEYSRFPFAYPCSNLSAATVIRFFFYKIRVTNEHTVHLMVSGCCGP
ncbi:unnamed protein product [Parnassius mnemosyne]|uniref:Integrase catalytic domain-containing protein n=1 Tax=Parnassius mnemosyne TaxID=213953 RepID=A0AAV1LS71_9NEOP